MVDHRGFYFAFFLCVGAALLVSSLEPKHGGSSQFLPPSSRPRSVGWLIYQSPPTATATSTRWLLCLCLGFYCINTFLLHRQIHLAQIVPDHAALLLKNPAKAPVHVFCCSRFKLCYRWLQNSNSELIFYGSPCLKSSQAIPWLNPCWLCPSMWEYFFSIHSNTNASLIWPSPHLFMKLIDDFNLQTALSY